MRRHMVDRLVRTDAQLDLHIVRYIRGAHLVAERKQCQWTPDDTDDDEQKTAAHQIFNKRRLGDSACGREIFFQLAGTL